MACKPHAREADLMQLVQVKDLLKVHVGTMQDPASIWIVRATMSGASATCSATRPGVAAAHVTGARTAGCNGRRRSDHAPTGRAGGPVLCRRQHGRAPGNAAVGSRHFGCRSGRRRGGAIPAQTFGQPISAASPPGRSGCRFRLQSPAVLEHPRSHRDALPAAAARIQSLPTRPAHTTSPARRGTGDPTILRRPPPGGIPK